MPAGEQPSKGVTIFIGEMSLMIVKIQNYYYTGELRHCIGVSKSGDSDELARQNQSN
jgi:hypothetical protein